MHNTTTELLFWDKQGMKHSYQDSACQEHRAAAVFYLLINNLIDKNGFHKRKGSYIGKFTVVEIACMKE